MWNITKSCVSAHTPVNQTLHLVSYLRHVNCICHVDLGGLEVVAQLAVDVIQLGVVDISLVGSLRNSIDLSSNRRQEAQCTAKRQCGKTSE